MTKTQHISRRARLGTAIAALAIGLAAVAAPTQAQAQPRAYASGSYRPTAQVALSLGEGQMITLPRNVASVWTSNPKVADVYVNSPRQLNLFGKDNGEATVIATGGLASLVIEESETIEHHEPDLTLIGRYGDGTVTGIAGWRATGEPVPPSGSVSLGGRNVTGSGVMMSCAVTGSPRSSSSSTTKI